MGRARLLIDSKELQDQITLAESAQKFLNQNELFKHICGTDWAKKIKDSCGKLRQVSPQNLLQRVTEFKLSVNTEKGKRGGGSGVRVKGKRFNGDSNLLLKSTPKEYHKLAKRVIDGSLKAATKLMCLSCSCYQPKEVTYCTVKSCPLWGFLKRKEANEEILQGSGKSGE